MHTAATGLTTELSVRLTTLLLLLRAATAAPLLLLPALTALLRAVPSPLLIVAIGALTWFLRRTLTLVIFVMAALLFIINQGYWQATLETLSPDERLV